MGNGPIMITKSDLKRLQKLVMEVKDLSIKDKEYVRKLEQELRRSEVITGDKVPADVITMNSKVRLKDVDLGEEMIFSLVFPVDADINEAKISVLAPIGTAILGYRVGDTISWEVPVGTRRLKVEEIIYQPEAAGDYDR
ncbi:MAG: nucleoside diphosphate kinase regulator [Heliobacteriaceae bacterium]|nr:nucleoside diphosphate kinase regulator [Heliobacteriaceae bacterium]MDD4588052.1 nucleoside diphosphate kinase regulator [Heliobacteriaceae bacterium]